MGGNAEAQNKNAIYYGPTHNPEHVAANVAGISPIGAGSVIWTPGDPNPALDWDLKTVADFKNYDVIVISDTGDELEPNSKIANPAVWAGAIRNAAVWSQATTGNILVVGTDPENHVRKGYRKRNRTLRQN